tara:strand:- start:279 stop:659 length:381 start_codon:yes stop_codon:yes gene_type:complete
MEVYMKKLIQIFFILILTIPEGYSQSYVASRQEMYFSDSSYYKMSHHIKFGKSVVLNNYKVFGELGIGEELNEGTPLGSGTSYDYLRFGITKTYFNSLKLNINYRSKMKSVGRDLNWIVINTKYEF